MKLFLPLTGASSERLRVAFLVAVFFGCIHRAHAIDHTFTLIDYVGDRPSITAIGINNSNKIVGFRFDLFGQPHGFVYANGVFSPIDYPGAPATGALGVNSSNDIVGWYYTASDPYPAGHPHGFLKVDDVFSSVDYPGASYTNLVGINDSRVIVGTYELSFPPGNEHGFVKMGDKFISIDYPGAQYTSVSGINSSGSIVGQLYGHDVCGFLCGFLYADGVFTVLDFPGALETRPSAINNSGDIVGYYSTPDHSAYRSFLYSGGVFSSIDCPGASVTQVFGINDWGNLTGVAFIDGVWHGFFATFAPIRVVSRKSHRTAGTFDINLPYAGTPGVECRSGGATGDYQIVFTFDRQVTFDSAVVAGGAGSISGTSGNGTSTIVVDLTGVTNAQRLSVRLLAASDSHTTTDMGVQLGVLVGDTGGNGVVSASDLIKTKGQVGVPLNDHNFREDVNANGSINASDVSLVKSKSGTGLP